MTLGDKLKFWLALNNYIEMIVHDTSLLSLPNATEDSLDYLKAFGGTEQRNLPDGYTQLEYIESTGTQYIDTGVGLNAANKITGKISFVTLYNLAYIAGGRLSGGVAIGYALYAASHSGFTIYNTRWPEQGIDVSANQILEFETVMKSGQQSFIVNGNTIVTGDRTIYLDSRNIYLFGLKTEYMAAAKVYSLKIYDNDTLVRNFVPAKNASGVVGMYDTVSGTFFTNAGTGTFTAGPVAVPTPDTPMNIVSNNGVLKANKNLYGTEYNGYELSQVDGITLRVNSGVNVSGMVDCRTIKSFKITTISPQGIFRVFKYGIDNTFIDAVSTASIGDILTLEDNVGFFRIQYNFKSGGTDTENILIYNSICNLGEIYADGTVEMINVHGKNFLDVNSSGIVAGYLASDGSLVQSTSWSVSDYIPIKANTTFTYSTTRPSGGLGSGAYLAYYDANYAFISTQNQGSNANKTFTTPAGTAYVKVSFFSSGNWQVELGSTATTYEPYFNGGTATAEMLLKVGNYQDAQSIIDGTVTRNVGVKVLDGTENWSENASFNGYRTSLSDYVQDAGGYCTHFKVLTRNSTSDVSVRFAYGLRVQAVANDYPTIQDWTNYLKAQYAAGTPVIVVYPLATSTTESVSGQALQVTEGNNIAEITQASLDNLELEAKYNSVP